MTDIEKLKWEVIEKLDPCNYEDTRRVIDYLHSRGYLGGVTEWQPIETAPKDDTKILLGCFSNGKWYEVLGRKKSYHYTLVPTGFRDFERATHWMPLPLPPENKDEK